MGNVVTIGLDIAKSVFQVHGVDAAGEIVIRRKLSRGRVMRFFESLPRCLIGIEACSSSHYWARELTALGHDVRLLPAQYVKPYLKRQKNDAADAEAICEESVATCRGIGEHGAALLEAISRRKGGATVNVLTHCNAGSLATINWGTATAPVYVARERGIDVHVWVDETRPRNQGSQLTAWELARSGIPHTVIVDNAGGHLMQHGRVDLCITGTDRTTRAGDVANKIGTYLKALAAHDNGVPFYVALPSTTIDWTIADGLRDIPIEERDASEVTHVSGLDAGEIREVRIVAEVSPVRNDAFDVTPARLVTGLITERGVCEASEQGLARLFPERAGSGS